ncbi:MAG: nucleoside hydrolase [Bacteroidales bacterium]|nr:nucleoside hydrolase [Bacteroidales bacterium]
MKRTLTIIAAALMMVACAKAPEVPQIIFDTDQGNDVDDVLALDVLNKLVDEGKIDVLAITLNKEGRGPVEFVDIMQTFYGHTDIPIGKITDGRFDPNDTSVNYAQFVADMKDEAGNPLFPRSIEDHDALPESYLLYRKALAGAKDHSVTIASVGFFTNLKRLYDSPADEFSPLTGRELVARKVKELVVVAGVFSNPELHEYNVYVDVPSAKTILEEWPTPVVVSPWELGINVLYPGANIDVDHAWAGRHPLAEAYKCYLPMPFDRPMWDDTAVLFAAGEEDWFTISPYGTIEVTPEGSTLFTEDPNGTRRHISVTPEQAAALRDYLVAKIARKPACYE